MIEGRMVGRGWRGVRAIAKWAAGARRRAVGEDRGPPRAARAGPLTPGRPDRGAHGRALDCGALTGS